MNGNLNDSTSIYLQIAAMLEDNIVRDLLLEEEQAPSTNELAKAFSINQIPFVYTMQPQPQQASLDAPLGRSVLSMI